MALPSLDGIKERKLVQWGLAYLAGAWLVLQVVAVLGATYGWPSGLLRAVPVLLGVGFLVALVVAWYHGERGAQRASGPELAILTVLLVLAGVGVMLVGGGADAAENAEAGMEPALAPEVDWTTIAVLPFETVGGEDYIADGLTDELIQTLGRVPGLQVTARTSAFAFKGSDARADSIGRALGVAHLVEGTVRTVGDQLRVTASLVDAETGRQAWSETYNRELADVLGLQEEIARAIAFKLRARVGSAARVGRPSTDPEAYLLTLRGHAIQSGGGDAYTELPGIYAEAIARDSTYAPAWAGLANMHQTIVETDSAEDIDAEWEAVRAAANRAIELDPRVALAHTMLGQVAYAYDGDLAAAQAHYERAVEATPSDALAWARLGFTRQFWGDEEGALRAVEQAVAIDPLSPGSLMWSGLVYLAAGKTGRALELMRAAYALFPNFGTATWLAEFLVVAGHSGEAIALLRPYVEERPSYQFGQQVLAYAYARTGDRRSAERHLSQITDPHTPRAWVEVAFGNTDAAFAALERSVAASEPYMEDLVVYPELIPLHDDPRWAGLVARVRAGAGQR
ncbi:tetratricopeptide repeat protein [Rubrivirga sp. IMCC45206]|uniref:tetratricopeptide repeat protein n=1 Tax=Rubrivirga sp. IMCC45206 TaxID=3391614 RepID=UPI003990257B